MQYENRNPVNTKTSDWKYIRNGGRAFWKRGEVYKIAKLDELSKTECDIAIGMRNLFGWEYEFE